MNIKELLVNGSGLFAILLTVIEFVPIKINPLSAIARHIGKAFNADITAKLEAHIAMDDRRTTDAHRARILHFNNELLRNIPHTKEEFIEVLAEIDAYEDYCREHDDYKNNRATLAIENIKENYRERLKKHDFLQEGIASDIQEVG